MAAVVISSAIASGANNCLAQTDHFKGEVDWLGVGLSSIVGAGTGLAGSALGKYGGRCGEKLENWVLQKHKLSTKTQYIGRIIIGGVTGGITSGIIGFSFGFGESLLFSDSLREAFERGWPSCKSSFIQGAIIGAITGCAEEYEQNRNMLKTNVENQNMEIPPINQCPEPNVPSLDLRPDYSSPQIPNSENLMNPLLFKYLDAKIKAGK